MVIASLCTILWKTGTITGCEAIVNTNWLVAKMAENKAAEPKKRGSGKRFQKGTSGNPGGRPKGVAEVRDMARAHTAMAIERLAFWARSNEPAASVSASNALLDRGWGKAPVKFEDEDGNTGLTVIIRKDI